MKQKGKAVKEDTLHPECFGTHKIRLLASHLSGILSALSENLKQG
ncbi:hypothetical protein SAMN05216218_12815 [Halorientalis regularis]|uniref:Uncharacterized protein n=1 Tax=Halorientalis regularis TaxID=660518 RepID=A0A1G7TSR8_9EURY|nr:hypothetical protein SAMN05216218_12815 [Halorientalis regularis]